VGSIGSTQEVGLDRSLRRLATWLLVAIALHNLEEGLTFPHFAEVFAMTARWTPLPARIPDWEQLQLALVFATLLPAAMISWSLGRPITRIKAGVITMIASVMLANAILPHLALTVLRGSYTPGAITALAINLPLCITLLGSLRRSGLLTKGQWALACISGIAALPVALVGILGLSGALLH